MHALDPICGLQWSDSVASAQKRVSGTEYTVHPDCMDDGSPDYVLFLKAPKIAGIQVQTFASFQRGKLASVQHRFPATKQARAQWTKKTADERIAAVNAILAELGCPDRVDKSIERFASTWTRDEYQFGAETFGPYLVDYAEAERCNPGTPVLTIYVSRVKAAKKPRAKA
jgi:hypothetical protein